MLVIRLRDEVKCNFNYGLMVFGVGVCTAFHPVAAMTNSSPLQAETEQLRSSMLIFIHYNFIHHLFRLN